MERRMFFSVATGKNTSNIFRKGTGTITSEKSISIVALSGRIGIFSEQNDRTSPIFEKACRNTPP